MLTDMNNSTEQIQEIQAAVRFLASRCDGARADDGMGFNGMDARFGHSLAKQAKWSLKQTSAAHRLLRKYRNQLAAAGIDYDALQVPTQLDSAPKTDNEIALDGDDKLAIRFAYDARLVDAVRQLADRRWEPVRKIWTVPVDNLLEIEEFAKRHDFKIASDAQALMDERREVAEAQRAYEEEVMASSTATETDLTVPVEGLMPFQKAGVAYALTQRRTFIADEMGLGKTVQALATLEADNAFPALIIVPNAVKLNWEIETRKWLPNRSVQVVNAQTRLTKIADVTILNYDIVNKKIDGLTGKFKSLVLDEGHYVKNYKAKRTKAVEELARTLTDDDPLILILTGTPVVNRPAELISQLNILNRLNDVGGFKHYWRHFCGYDQRGAQNLNELNLALRAKCMVRRLKEDVLPELPPRTFSMQPVSLSNAAEYARAERDFMGWLAQTNPEAMTSAERAEALTKINVLRHLAASGKVEESLDWIKNALETNGKLVVFAHHQDIIAALMDGLSEFNPVEIKGGMSNEAKQASIVSFQNDETVRVIVCSLKAAGVGITLTAASNVAFVELGWTPADMAQAVDRCHRIGQKDAVTGWELVAPKSIDQYMLEILAEKQDIMDQILDGKAPAEAGESILAELLTRMREERV